MSEIYFDNSATTRVLKSAADVSYKVMTEEYGNPSSVHGKGVNAQNILSECRQRLLSSLGVRPRGNYTVFFTGSGTEADNMAVTGVMSAKKYRIKPRIITTDSEHPAVLSPIMEAEKNGADVIRLSTKGGVIDMNELISALTPETVLVSVMLVNNETGAVYDVNGIFNEVKKRCPDAVTHCDAIQGYMKLPINISKLGCDLMTVSAHKIGAPKGLGALICENSLLTKRRLAPVIFGGGQEQGFRSGTENLPAIAAFSAAISEHKDKINENYEYVSRLREKLVSLLPEGVTVNVPEKEYLPHIISITAEGIKSEVLVRALSAEGIYISAGSACSSKKLKTSTVLTAFGHSPDKADSTVRVSICPENTATEAEIFVKVMGETLNKLTRKR